MRERKPHYLRWLVLGVVFVGLALLGYRSIGVWAEQLGDPAYTPESGQDSRLKQLSDELAGLNYGSETVGSEDDWGAYWNRIRSAAQTPFNGALALGVTNGGNSDYPATTGGISDTSPLPDGSYRSDWLECNSGNDYCGLDDEGGNIADMLDQHTGLIWSERIATADNWFTANNCHQPETEENPGTCVGNTDSACKCVKKETAKTGCESRVENGGGWRLPHQKELMLAYIHGSAAVLSDPANQYWSSTTVFGSAQHASITSLSNGNTFNAVKATAPRAVRCVR